MTAPDPDDQAWRTEARCAETDAELWFPPSGGKATTAKAICAQCPVQPECLTHALQHYEAGIWGGKTEYERRQLRNTNRGTPGVPRPKALNGRQIPDLAHRLREWRWVNDLTQDAAAQQLGITKNMLADYETGRHQPKPGVRAVIDMTIGGTP